MWNNNLDKKFDGVEECYICFAVLHPGTYQLPKLSCKTCRKKFHAACLVYDLHINLIIFCYNYFFCFSTNGLAQVTRAPVQSAGIYSNIN